MQYETLVATVVGMVTSVATWYAARRKNRADVQANELENVEKAVRFYREMVEDLGTKLKEATNEIHKTSNLHREAIDELTSARQEIKNLEARLEGLAIQNKELITQNKELIDELRKYKQLNGKRA